MKPENRTSLHSKLDAFIRKYYKNQLIKGLIYSTGLLVAFFLLTTALEYVGEFETGGRTTLFWCLVLSASFVVGKYILMPATKLARMGKTISYEQAAKIVGDHFSDVQDKILNTLQLGKMLEETSPEQYALVQASISQRTQSLKPIPFNSAIDLSQNKRHLWWALVPVVIFGAIYLLNSEIITKSTDRLLHHGSHYEKSAPFTFILENDSLEVIEKEDFNVVLKIEGNYAPEKVFISTGDKLSKMDKENAVTFRYTIKDVSEDMQFHFSAEDFKSKGYELKVIPNPVILNFEVDIDYPEYTNRIDQTIKNTGDLIIPEGTRVKWKFKTTNTNEVQFAIDDSTLLLRETIAGKFELEKRMFKSTNYTVKTKNEFITNKMEVNYFLNVIKDEYPKITLEEKTDSNNNKHKYFSGDISDDYGFSNLTFNYKIVRNSDSIKQEDQATQRIKINGDYNRDQFYHFWDISEIKLRPGDQIEYYFSVWDNDAVNGPKNARTQARRFKAPTKKELSSNADKANDKIKKELEESIKEARNIRKEMRDAQKDLLNKKNMSWQDKNKIEELMNRQKQLEEKVNKMQNQNKLNNQQQQQYKELSQEILEKQKMLEELFDKIMDDEMKKLFEELEKLIEELNKDKVNEKLEEMNWNQEDIEKSMDESLELFKQFEFEQKVEDVAEKLNDLAKKQEELSKKSEEKKSNSEQLKEEQEELNKEFEEVKKDVEKLEQLNDELQNKHDLDNPKEDMQSIEDEMQKSSEELQNNKKKKAASSQKSAAEQMKESAQKMKDMLASSQQQKAEEDMQALRMLLENLITFSFDQETVMEELKSLSTKDPKYVELGREQRKLMDDAKILEDSLRALAKRQAMVANVIGDELKDMKHGITNAIEHIKERQTPQARNRQQHTMTAANNLALLLDEALQSMQQQMASKMPGTGQCEKPGGMGKKPSSGNPSQSLSEMRKQMQKQLEKMKDAMEKGKNPGDKNEGGKKPGENGKGGQGQMPANSEELAKLAAQQEAIRKEIQRLSQELNEDGSGLGNGLKKIAKDMEKLEEEIVNDRLSNESLMRQKDIISRLLEHEKATRQQDFDDKRKSESVKNEEYSNPNKFFEYKRRKEKEVEMLKTVPPDLKQYYKNKINEYFNKVD